MSSSTLTDTTGHAPSQHVLRQRRRAQVGSLIGTTIEWYEYYIYGATAALVFPTLFFPADDPLVSVIASFASSRLPSPFARSAPRSSVTSETGSVARRH